MAKGFIIDAPEALIISGNNTYNCVTAASGQIQFQGSSLEIKGGLSLYDLISIPTGTSLSVTLTDTQIDGDMMNIAMGATATKDASVDEYKFGVPFIATTGATPLITINEAVKVGTLKINGMIETAGVPTAGQYKVEVISNTTTVTFAADMTGKTVMPSYAVVTTGVERYDVLNTAIPRKGMVVLKFPVYSGDSVSSSITATAQLTIYSASINQNMTMGGSYKSASTFELSIKGLDSKRADKKVFSLDFIPVAD